MAFWLLSLCGPLFATFQHKDRGQQTSTGLTGSILASGDANELLDVLDFFGLELE